MKKTISLFLGMFLFAIICNAQSDVKHAATATGGQVLARAEVMPSFKGGKEALDKYLAENLKYPAAAKASKTEGLVYVEFIVNTQGKVINPTILRGTSSDLDAEALRVVSSMPDWIPGKQDGKEVSVSFTLPVHFKL